MTNLYSKSTLQRNTDYLIPQDKVSQNGEFIFFIDSNIDSVYIIDGGNKYLPHYLNEYLKQKRIDADVVAVTHLTADFDDIVSIYICTKTDRFGKKLNASNGIILNSGEGGAVVRNYIAAINCRIPKRSSYGEYNICVSYKDDTEIMNMGTLHGLGISTNSFFPLMSKSVKGLRTYDIKLSSAPIAYLNHWMRNPSRIHVNSF